MSVLHSSGQVAAQLGVTEPRLNDLIRRGKIDPVPPVVAGRRLWDQQHVAQAAAALDLPVAKPATDGKGV